MFDYKLKKKNNSCVRPPRLRIDFRCFVSFKFYSQFFKCSLYDKSMFDFIEIKQANVKHTSIQFVVCKM